MFIRLFVCLLVVFLILSFNNKRLFGIENSSTATYPVGVLGKNWQFPSDHLPVGLSVGKIHLAAWNVLNSRYIYHILTNQQGLKDSLIVTANTPVEMHSYLTMRESIIIDHVLEMIHHSSHPRSIVALQEVGDVFFAELKKKLPEYMNCVTIFQGELGHGDIFIYNTKVFNWIDLRSGHYQIRPRNSYMTLTLQEIDTGLLYHFVQSHVPAAPGVSASARREFAQEILSHFDSGAITIVMGDMNRSPDFFLRNFEEVAKDIGMKHQPLRNLWIPYATHIDTQKNASWIDNIFFHNPYPDVELEVSADPQTLFPGMLEPTSLLRSLRPLPLDVSFEIWCNVKIRGTTVIYGTQGSGKTEQMLLALKGEKIKVFNLQQEFLEDYYREYGIDDFEERLLIRSRYPSEDSLQTLEYGWLNKKNIQIVEELLSSDAEVIVFDDFDLTVTKELNPHKLSTLLSITSMAKRIRNHGKKVIFLLHDASLKSSLFWDELSQQFELCKQDVIKTRFLNMDEEFYLLDYTDLSDEDKVCYQKWASGAPSAYLKLIEFVTESFSEGERLHVTLNELMAMSLEK